MLRTANRISCLKLSSSYDGFALYPQWFIVNITSHIEWYTRRGVEITVVLSTRDRSISTKHKTLNENHCKSDASIRKEEEDIALQLMMETLERYGKRESSSNNSRERALVASYEGFMRIGKSYLFDLYKNLGINSTYVPNFIDENTKYSKKMQRELPRVLPLKAPLPSLMCTSVLL